MAGDPVEILPDRIRLTLGISDVLLLRNSDDVPQMFGPTLMMPGQSFRLPFDTAATYSFACTAHASGDTRTRAASAASPTLIFQPSSSSSIGVLGWGSAPRGLLSLYRAADAVRLTRTREGCTRLG